MIVCSIQCERLYISPRFGYEFFLCIGDAASQVHNINGQNFSRQFRFIMKPKNPYRKCSDREPFSGAIFFEFFKAHPPCGSVEYRSISLE